MVEHGVVCPKGASLGDFLFIEKKHVTPHLASLIVHPHHLFETRVHYLFRVI